jgi:hypothetical protein
MSAEVVGSRIGKLIMIRCEFTIIMGIACTLVAVVTLKNVYIAVVVIVVVVVQIVVLTCP